MSTTVDERVVSMQFDNKHFEANVRTSMSTLEKLKQALHLKGATKGLEEVNAAAKRCDLSSIGASADKVGLRFSAMYTMADQAFRNIYNSAERYAKNIISAFTIDPVKTGFQEYETQIGATQTILANVKHKGKTLDDVNTALDELNTYADQTIYNFTEMTRNIGLFTNAGVGLDESVSAIKGFSNAAAMAGTDATRTAGAMYQLSQAMSSGKVQLMDWRSLEQANITGERFQETIIETARAHGIAIDDMIAEEGTLRDTLKKGWLTADLMSESLEHYTLSTKTMTEAEIAANRERLKSKGYTEEQIDKLFELGTEATAAATEVKTFSQLWGVLQESAQSGWSKTWKLLIGDFDQAKQLLTPLANFLTGVIDGISDFRNKFLGGALTADPWKNITDKFSGIQKVAKKVTDVTDKLTHFQDVVNKVWRGDYGNEQPRFDALEAEGYNSDVVQDLVNLGYGYKLTLDDITASEKKFGVTTEEASEKSSNLATTIENLSDEQLKNIGLTDEEIELYRDLAEEAKRTGRPVEELLEKMSKKDGRTLLIESLKNAGSGLISVITAIKDAWLNVFPPMSSVRLYTLIEGINTFSEKLVMSEETSKNLRRTFEGLFAAIDIVGTLLAGPIKIAFKVLTALLDIFDVDILELTAGIGDAIVGFRDWLDSVLDFRKILEPIAPLLKSAGEAIKNWFSGIDFGSIFGNIGNFFKDLIDGVKLWIAGLKEADNIPEYIIGGLVNGLKNGIGTVGQAIWNIGVAIINKIKEVLGIHSPSKVFFAIGGFIIAGLVSGLQNGTGEVWDTLRNLFGGLTDIVKGIDLGSIFAMFLSGGVVVGINNFATAFKNLTAPLEGVNDVLGSFSNLIDKNVKPIGKVIKNSAKVVKSFSKVLGSFSMAIKAEALKSIALAILMLVGAIAILTFLDQGKMIGAVIAIGALMGCLLILASAVGKISDPKIFASFGLLLLGLMGMFATMAILLKVLEGLDPNKMGTMFLALVGMLGVMTLFIVALAVINRDIGAIGSGDDIGKTMFKLATSLLVMALVIKILGNLKGNELAQGLFAITYLTVIISALMAVSRVGGFVDNVGSTILKISAAMLLMTAVIFVIGNMEPDKLVIGLSVVYYFGVLIAGLMAVAKHGNDGSGNVGDTILKVGVAMLLMAAVMKIVGGMSLEEMIKGGVVIFYFSAIVAALMAVTKKIGGPAEGTNIGLTLLGVAGAIAILAGVAILLGYIETEKLAKGVIAVGALSVLVMGLMAVTKYARSTKNLIKSMVVISVAIGVMALAVTALSFLDPAKLAVATGCMSALMGMFAVMMLASKNVTGSMGALIVMTVAIGVMAGALYLLSTIETGKALESALALSLVMAAMALVLIGVSKLSGNIMQAISGVVALTLLAIPLLAFTLILGLMSGIQNATQNALVLAGLVAAMALVLIPLTIIGNFAPLALAGVVALTLMALPLAAFVGVLAIMSLVQKAASNAIILADLATRLTLLLIPLTIVGLLGPGAMIGVLALTALAIPLLAFVGILAIMQCIGNATQNAMLIGNLMLTLATVIMLIAPLGPLALIAVAAVAGLEALMIATAALATIMAGLSKIPGFKEFLDTGIDMVIRLAEGVGEIVGAFITGFTNSIKDSLPALGLCLSQFMKNVRFFIIGAQMVNDKVLTGVGILSGAVIALTAANLISSIGSFLSFGSSFADLGTELSRFMLNAMPFITMSSLLKPEMVNSVKNLAETILILTASDILDGIFSFLTGGSSLADFGAELASFGPSLKTFAESVSGLDEHSLTAMDTAATAAEKLANMANSMPKTGGLLGGIFGESNPADFGRKMAAFGQSLVTYGESVAGLTQDKIDAINISTEAAQGLSDLANSMPKGDSLLGMITGSPTDIQTFGSQLEAFGGSIVTYAESVTNLNESKVTAIGTSIDATKKLVDLANTLPEGNGFFDIFGGGQTTIEQFGTQLASFGTALSSFSTSVSGIDTGKITAAATASEKLGSMAVSIANAGNVDLVDFGYQLDQFGGHVKTYFTNIDLIPAGSVTNSANAVSAIAKFSSGFDPEKAKAAASAGWTLVKMAKGMATVPEGSTAGFVASIKALGELNISSFLNAFKEGRDSIEEAGRSMVTAIVDGVKSKLIYVRDVGHDVTDRLAKGITSAVKTAKSAVSSLVDDCISTISSKDNKTAFATAGENLVKGFANGISEATWRAEAKASAMASAAVEAAKAELDEHSPSRVFYGIGEFTGIGFINALTDYTSKVYNSGSDMGGSAIDGIRDAIAKISTMTVDDMDISPTIRPVIDMSDVQAGASTINSMFGSGTLSVNARNVGAISAAMSNRQNGAGNDDIVSSINALRKDISDMPRNTYSINGITYDDGSNIADAMKTIVRAARVERRK